MEVSKIWPSHPWAPYLVIIGLPILLLLLCYFLKRPFMPSLKKKHVFITGGSSGIGLAIAEAALVQGAYVTLISRSVNNLASAVDSLLLHAPLATADRIRYEAADVSDYEALARVIERAFTWRPIDVFVCNAGLTRGGYLGDGRIQDLEITVQTNFMGSVNALHAALPLLKRHSRGQPVSIVIMASLASLFFMYGHSVYTATKYAVRGLAEGLRFELLPFNIKVSLICPGFTSTPFLDEADKEKEIQGLLKWVNLYDRRWAESPKSVAIHSLRAIKWGAFLVSTNPLGLVLSTLGRGFVPADSFLRLIFELLFILPFRIVSFVIIPIFRLIVHHKGVTSPYDDVTMASHMKPMVTTIQPTISTN